MYELAKKNIYNNCACAEAFKLPVGRFDRKDNFFPSAQKCISF